MYGDITVQIPATPFSHFGGHPPSPGNCFPFSQEGCSNLPGP